MTTPSTKTRREALVMIGMIPLASMAVPATLALAEEPLTDTSIIPDRELTLTVSDNFQRQHWLYAGQRYSEMGKPISVDEHECVRLILINDTGRGQSLLLDGTRIDIAARKSCKHDLLIADLQSKVLSNPAAGFTRIIRVRPSYQSHAAFLA